METDGNHNWPEISKVKSEVDLNTYMDIFTHSFSEFKKRFEKLIIYNISHD